MEPNNRSLTRFNPFHSDNISTPDDDRSKCRSSYVRPKPGWFCCLFHLVAVIICIPLYAITLVAIWLCRIIAAFLACVFWLIHLLLVKLIAAPLLLISLGLMYACDYVEAKAS